MINLRLSLAGMNYYAASKARNSIQEGIQRSYFNVVCQARVKNGIPFPTLTELLGFNLSLSSEQQDKLNELTNRKNNLRKKINTYNAQVHGRAANEMEPYIPLATSTTSTMNAEDAAIAALTNSSNKRKLPVSYQQVTPIKSTLTNDIDKQYPSTYTHTITGPELQDTETLSPG
jgi:hypothetical protein